MVWMMLEQRKTLHEEKTAFEIQVKSLEQQLKDKDAQIEDLEVINQSTFQQYQFHHI